MRSCLVIKREYGKSHQFVPLFRWASEERRCETKAIVWKGGGGTSEEISFVDEDWEDSRKKALGEEREANTLEESIARTRRLLVVGQPDGDLEEKVGLNDRQQKIY